MANGTLHATSSIILAGAFTASALLGDYENRLQYAAGALVGVIVTNDMDLMGLGEGGNVSNSIIGKAGKLVRQVWKWVWMPYGELQHRSFTSHFPFVATYGRIFYLLFYVQIGCLIAEWFGYPFGTNYEWFLKTVLQSSVVVGLLASDILHTLMDSIWSKFKRLKG